MKKAGIIVCAIVLLFAFYSCSKIINEPPLIVEFESEELPKKAFLKFVDESSDLTDADKKTIRENVNINTSAGGYTHVKLTKYTQDGESILSIDTFYPSKQLGGDSSGHPIMTGRSGSITEYKYDGANWQIWSGTHYD